MGKLAVIKNRHKKAARLLCLGYTRYEIAKRIGVEEMAVRKWLKDDLFLGHLAELQGEFLQALEREIVWLRRSAIRKVRTALKSKVPSNYQWGAEMVLGRGGLCEGLRSPLAPGKNGQLALPSGTEPERVLTDKQKHHLKALLEDITVDGHAEIVQR